MNWFSITSNALWIIALACGITVVGMNYWESVENKVSLSEIFTRPKRLGALYLFLLLFSVGLGLLVSPMWGKFLWFGFALISLILAWSVFKSNHKKR